MPKRDPRLYGLTAADRLFASEQKCGSTRSAEVHSLLQQVIRPSEMLPGAIIFLARDIDDLPALVTQANQDPDQVLRAATVKDERS